MAIPRKVLRDVGVKAEQAKNAGYERAMRGGKAFKVRSRPSGKPMPRPLKRR